MLCLFQRSLARKLPANAGVALWKVALIQADRLLPERRLLGTNPADVLESCFGGLPDAQPLRVCALMRLPQLCRPSVNWRFLVLYGYGPDVGVRDRSQKYPAAASFSMRGSRSVPRYSSIKSSRT